MYLQKALYGLKNSAKAWFDTFSTYLKGLGYEQSHYDECLYEFKNDSKNSKNDSKNSKNKKIYIIVFVDDALAVGDDDLINDIHIKNIPKIQNS